MSEKMMNFTAEASIKPAVGRYGSSRVFPGGTPGVLSYQENQDSCSCWDPKAGCWCLPFCHKKTWTAVTMCQSHMANNAACKNPNYVCFGCQYVAHSDHAEYHICRA